MAREEAPTSSLSGPQGALGSKLLDLPGSKASSRLVTCAQVVATPATIRRKSTWFPAVYFQERGSSLSHSHKTRLPVKSLQDMVLKPRSRPRPSKVWVDPASLPDYGDISTIAGNAPDFVKQLNSNTYFSYGVGDEDCFGHKVGKAVKFVEVSVDRRLERQGRMEATTVAEVLVTKHMLNGAGMLHGGCVAYLIDNCCSTPLVVLGLLQNVNGVGVTQAMNVLFHSPAPIGTRLRIVSTSISLGGRVMTSRCEIVDKDSGRAVASAFLNKMQPASSKL